MHVDVQHMHATAEKMSALADDFWEDIESLRRSADYLMSVDWTGDASGSHSALWAEWVDSARSVVGALAGDAALLHQAANDYEKTEAESVGRLSSLDLG